LPLRAVFQIQNLHPTANLLSTGRSSTLWFLWSTPWSVRCWEDPEGFRLMPYYSGASKMEGDLDTRISP
jgi:hypothetical protein